MALLGTAGADARTFEVTRLGDPTPGDCRPNDCSLREAVLAANERVGADKVVLPSRKKAYRLTIPNELGVPEDGGMTGDLDVSNDRLAIFHPGRGRATVGGSAGLDDRLLEVFQGAPLRITKLRLTGGEAPNGTFGGGAITAGGGLRIERSVLVANEAAGVGGAIDMSADAPLRVLRSAVTGNEAGNTAGAIRSGEGPITITRSRLTGNIASSRGGAMRLSSNGPVSITDSTIAGNRAGDYGGGIQNDAEESLSIRDSTISGNFSALDGGGLQVGSDAFTTRIFNTTISGNRTNGFGGGIYVTGAAPVILNAVTVARNRAAADDPGNPTTIGGGLYTESSEDLSIRNSLVTLNRAGADGVRNDCGHNPAADYNSLGNNLYTNAFACDAFDGPGDRLRAKPRIGTLKRNGGPTKTIALKQRSPAIGRAHGPSAPSRDQRGRKRDSKPDIGAYER